jgi:DNA-binding Lrp family transcriptional regulator
MPNPLEPVDLHILAALQQDGRLTNQALSAEIGLSTSPCWRRVRQLEEDGVIQGYRAALDRRRIGLGVLAFIRVKIDSHSAAEAEEFAASVRQLREVVACYSIAGIRIFCCRSLPRTSTAMPISPWPWSAACPGSRRCRPPSC